MVDFPQMLRVHLLQIKWIQERLELTTLDQKTFLETLDDSKPLTDDEALMLGQVYRCVQDMEDMRPAHIKVPDHYVDPGLNQEG